MRRSLVVFLGFLLLAGCADFPQLDASVSDRARAAAYPRILPLDGLLAVADARPEGAAAAGLGNLPARLARLQARANAMRGRPVIDPATRARLRAALARHR